jgi:hypothetical protein
VYPALAGLAGRARDRVLLGGIGYLWLATAEIALERKLLFGPSLDPAAGWQRSVGATLTEVLLPLATSPEFLLGAAIWSLGALALGALVRGHSMALDLLGALLWAAGLVVALRLDSGASTPSPAALAIAVLAVVAATLAWRARAGGLSPRAPFPAPAAGLEEAGREATLP